MADRRQKDQSQRWWGQRWVRNSALVVFFILLIYTLVGFFLAPYLLEKQLVKYLEKDLAVEAEIGGIAINPYTLTLRVEDFSLWQQGKPKLIGFDQLYVNFELLGSVLHDAWAFEEIRLGSPYLNLKINEKGQLNLAELMPPEEIPPAKDKVEVPLISHQISIEKGHIHFVDQSPPVPVERNLKEISVSLTEFSTLLGRSGSYSFEAANPLEGTLQGEGHVTLNPLRSKGHFSLRGVNARTLWQYLRDQVGFEVTRGQIGADINYILDTRGSGPLQLTLNNIAVALSQLELEPQKGERKILVVPRFGLAGGQVHWPEKIIAIEQIVMAGAELHTWLNEQGMLNWQEWLATKTSAEKKPTPAADTSSPGWQVAVKKINVKDFAASFQDKTTEPPVSVDVSDLDLQLTDIALVPGVKSHFNLNFYINERSQASAQGGFNILPPSLDAEIHLTGFPLPPFQPYLSRFVKLELNSGNLEIEGNIEYAQRNATPHFRFEGDLALQQLSTEGPLIDERLLAWDVLKANQMWIELFPPRVQIGTVALENPYAKIAISENGKINIKEVLSPLAGKTEKKETPPESKSAPVPITIDLIHLKGGSVEFIDLSLPEKFSISSHSLQGRIQNLSSRAEERASVLLEGTIESYGLTKIIGKADLFALKQATELGALFQNIKLPMLTPYAVKFIGYSIENGSLSLDLDYQIKKGHLEGVNEIIVNDLILGEKVASSGAINAPIKLAVALLKNPEGQIYIRLPVKGDLKRDSESLQFSYGQLINNFMKGFIVGVVSSPFRVLAGLVDAEEAAFKFVEFEPGSSELLPPAQEKLLQLAEALKQRPALQLQLQGQYDPIADARFLKRKQLEVLLSARLKQEASSRSEDIPDSQQALKLLEQLYRKEFSVEALNQARTRFGHRPAEAADGGADKPAKISPSPESSSYRDFLQEQLVEVQSINEGKLRQLGRARAAAIKEYLGKQGGIREDRIEVLQAEPVKESGQDLIRFQFELSGR